MTDMILTTIFISIPEVMLLTLITIILLKEYQFLRKENIRRNLVALFTFVALPQALFALTTFFLDIELYTRLFLNSCTTAILIYNMFGYFGRTDSIKGHIKDIVRTYISSAIPIAILFLLEMVVIYMPQSLFSFYILASKTTPLSNFLLAFPIQLSLLTFIYYNYIKINTMNSNVLSIIWKENTPKRIIVQLLLNIVLIVFTYNKFVVDGVIQGLTGEQKAFIIVLIIDILIVGNLIPWFVVLTLKMKQKQILDDNLV